MSKIDEVRAAMVAAMKAKDKVRKDSLSMLLSALKNAEIDKRSPLTEEEENAVVKKELRQSKETYDLAPEERQDIREEMAARIAVYKEFAPEDMSAEQIAQVFGIQPGKVFGFALEDTVGEILELGVHALVQRFGFFLLQLQ